MPRSTSEGEKSAHRYAALDGWRGICALLVATLHFEAASHIAGWRLVTNAGVLVDFFFVLSGFVISHAYVKRAATPGDVAAMIVRRIARLWPLHVAVLLAFIAMEIATALISASFGIGRRAALFDASRGFPLDAIPAQALMLNSMGLQKSATWNVASWSIGAEFWTCVVFAAVLLFGRTMASRVAAMLMGLGAAVVILIAPEGMDTTYDYGFFRCLYGFFVGYFVHRLYAGRRTSSSAGTTLEVTAVAGVLIVVCLGPGTSAAFLAPVMFGAVVMVFACGSGCISRLLVTRPIQCLGRWSYSIYMVHGLILIGLGRAFTVIGAKSGVALTVPAIDKNGPTELISIGGHWGTDAATLGYLVMVVSVAAATYRWIEMPAKNLVLRYAAGNEVGTTNSARQQAA